MNDNNNNAQPSVSGNFYGQQLVELKKYTTIYLFWTYVAPATGGQTVEAKIQWNDVIGQGPEVMVPQITKFISERSKDPENTIQVLTYDWHFVFPGVALTHYYDKVRTYNETLEPNVTMSE